MARGQSKQDAIPIDESPTREELPPSTPVSLFNASEFGASRFVPLPEKESTEETEPTMDESDSSSTNKTSSESRRVKPHGKGIMEADATPKRQTARMSVRPTALFPEGWKNFAPRDDAGPSKPMSSPTQGTTPRVQDKYPRVYRRVPQGYYTSYHPYGQPTRAAHYSLSGGQQYISGPSRIRDPQSSSKPTSLPLHDPYINREWLLYENYNKVVAERDEARAQLQDLRMICESFMASIRGVTPAMRRYPPY
ncbi:hypothetical protein QVD17_19523 [Tagetes erecta]|uniref:Uncharacterized protein n=1 Tax=Tagetes erecta TaxID=13708 RepID=A0AAD8NX04_TARER|nr:hypothetical protein QVD17_19523 [Tagetes erecta]